MMKYKRVPVLITLALSLLIIGYTLWQCTAGGSKYSIITISGSSFSNNLSKNFLKFGSVADSGKTAALLVNEGDLLYLVGDPSDNAVIFQYRQSDGQQLKLTTDTAFLYKSFLNDKLHSLYFSDPEDVADWKEETDLSDIAGLRAIHINGSALKDDVSFLEEIAALNPNPGLVLENFEQEQLTRTLSMFTPGWLFLMDTGLEHVSDDLLPHLKNIETIVIDAEYKNDLDFLYRLPNLRSLIFESFPASDTTIVHFGRMKNLVSLGFMDSEIMSLSSLELPKHLRSLSLIACDQLTDISGLNELRGLRQLSLLACDTLSDLSVLNDLDALEMLSLPPTVTQQDFADIIGHHSSLKAIELIGCEGINDLSPLTQLEGLISLTVDLPEIDFSTLEQLTGIKLIIIEQGHYDASEEQVAALKKALPDAQVVPGGGFCMGSGWILLMLPVLLVVSVLTGKRIRIKS